MNITGDNLKFIMGFKIKQLRQERGLSLTALAAMTGMSVSYLSEIETGKKYPKPEKIIAIAQALGVSFDELVSLQMNKEQDPLSVVFSSPVVKEFPFHLYGVSSQDLLSVIISDPQRSGALIRTFLEIGQAYNMHVEHLLLMALRSYQQMNLNYFADIEAAARRCALEHRLPQHPPITHQELAQVLIDHYGYVIDEHSLGHHPELKDFRSVWIKGSPPRLLLRSGLSAARKAFVFGREIGFQYQELHERSNTSSILKVTSFEQMVNNFRASYFSGALMMPQESMLADLGKWFAEDAWQEQTFPGLVKRYNVTPEMFFYRMTELLPTFLGLKELLLSRFHHTRDSGLFRLTKMFNMSRVFIPNGVGVRENYCRRWVSLRLLKHLAEQAPSPRSAGMVTAAQRARFQDIDAELFTISYARPSADDERMDISGALSFVVDENLKRTVKYWDDPAVPVATVNQTCERCSISRRECADRAAEPVIFQQEAARRREDLKLTELMSAFNQTR